MIRKLCILNQFKPKMTLKKRSKNHQKTAQIVAVILFQKMGLEVASKIQSKGLSVKNAHIVFNLLKDQLKKLQS
jgi:predicted transposase YdaD